jgi:hypothetical protein
MQTSLTVITPAQDISLVSLYEAKIALNLGSSSNPALDDQISLMIEWSSAEIAAMCNRTFAKETVTETFRDVDTFSNRRIFLSRYPVISVSNVDEDGDVLVVGDHYDIDSGSGTITRMDSAWLSPSSITYTGGYDLPNNSPRALRQAAILMVREAYYASVRGDASVRMVAHKESRIIYFDPNALAVKAAGGGAGGSPARRAVGDLLKHFTRFWI